MRRVLGRISFCVLHAAFCVCLVGCNVVGAIAYKVAPEPTIPAQFPLPVRTTVVIVENFHNPASLRLESEAVSRTLVELLATNTQASIIHPDELENLRQSKGPAYRAMPLDAIAKELGAEQVVYVDLERFDMVRHVASESPGGEAEARVRLVDAATGDSLWPIDAAGGQPVTMSIDPQRVTANAPDEAVSRLLQDGLADQIGKLFYSWKGDSMDGAAERF